MTTIAVYRYSVFAHYTDAPGGQIMHKGVAFPGQHQAIVDADLFDAAQRLLERN